MKTLTINVFALSILLQSLTAMGQGSIFEQSSNEWSKEVAKATERNTVGAYFIFRDLEIHSENGLFKAQAEEKAAQTELRLTKEILNRNEEVFKKRALSEEEMEDTRLWAKKAEKEVEKAKLKVQKEKALIEITRISRQETVTGEKIGDKLPPLYLKTWGVDCQVHLIDEQIAKAELNLAERKLERRKKSFAQDAASGFEVIEAMANWKKAQHTLEGQKGIVQHCRGLELLPASEVNN